MAGNERLQATLKKLLAQLPADELLELNEEAQYLAEWKIAAFKPHDKQDKFFRSGAKIRLFQGGNRSGKSTAGCLEAVAHMLGYRPWLSRGDPDYAVKVRTPNKGRIVCEDFQATAKQIIVPKLFEWIPRTMIEDIRKNPQGVEIAWKLTNGSRLNIMTNEQATDIFEGWDGDWCIEENQLVTMADMTKKPIKDIEVGDQVWALYTNRAPKVCAVTHKVCNGVKDVYKLTTVKGHEIICTANHKFLTGFNGYVELQHLRSFHKLVIPFHEKRETKGKHGWWKKDLVCPDTIEYMGQATVYDISVEGLHNFVCQDICVHNCWYDEPPRREHFIATQRGLVDHDGRAWLTMTPLKEPWIYDEIVLKAGKNKDIAVFVVDTMDNVGFGLTKDAVDSFAELLTPEEREARLNGKFRRLQGLIYKEFNPDVHMVKPFAIPPNWPRAISIDPHPRNPHMVLWMTVDPYGNRYVYDELYSDMLIPDLCKTIKEKTGNDKVAFNIIDPSAYVKNPLDGSCWADEFIRLGIPVQPASKELSRGIQAVKRELLGTNGKPNLYFFNTLERTIWEMGRYQWSDWKGRSADTRSPKETPVDKDDHAMECMYRLVLLEMKWRDMDMDDADLVYPPSDVP